MNQTFDLTAAYAKSVEANAVLKAKRAEVYKNILAGNAQATAQPVIEAVEVEQEALTDGTLDDFNDMFFG